MIWLSTLVFKYIILNTILFYGSVLQSISTGLKNNLKQAHLASYLENCARKSLLFGFLKVMLYGSLLVLNSERVRRGNMEYSKLGVTFFGHRPQRVFSSLWRDVMVCFHLQYTTN